MTTLRRFTGEVVGQFGEALDGRCEWAGCSEQAVLLPCNAEGEVRRAHRWGGVHDLSLGWMGCLCEAHGLLLLASNARIGAAWRVGKGR